MAVVYVVQRQISRGDNGGFVDRFDLVPAEAYGRLEFLLGPRVRPWDPVVPELHEKLRWYTDQDYLLLVGNPCLIGLTAAVASEYSSTLNFLQWNGHEHRYLKVSANVGASLPAR